MVTMRALFPVFRRWLLGRHRGLALWVALPALAWSLTGVLHPVMSRWQPSAVAMQPPAEMLAPPPGLSWSALPAPARLLPQDLPLRELRAVTWQGTPYWLAQSPDGSLRYFDARDGRPADIERQVVESLARHYTGESSAAVSLSRVQAFSPEYAFVNRYLPVWRVAFDRPDGLVAFIEPRSLLLTALTDTWKTRFSWLFGNLHSWKWWPHEPSRDLAMTLALGLIALMALAGVARAAAAPAAGRPALKRWHRRLGLLVTLAVFAWCVSGIFHVLAIEKGRPGFATYPLKLQFRVADVMQPAPADVPARARLQVLATPYGPLWHWHFLQPPGQADKLSGRPMTHHAGHAAAPASASAEHVHKAEAAGAPVIREGYASARTGATIMPIDYVRALTAGVASGARWLTCEPVTRFNPEYGFVQKRLPVYKVSFDTPDHLAVYIDPVDAAVASVVRDLDRAEGFSFAYLHKVHWLDFLGKDVRDAVAGFFALLVFGLTLVGVGFLRRR